MGNPAKPLKNVLQVIQNEIVSTMSALNMCPDPIYDDPDSIHHCDDSCEDGRPLYLSETDENAKHAMEHLQELVNTVSRASAVKERIRDAVFALYRDHELSADSFDILYDLLEEL